MIKQLFIALVRFYRRYLSALKGRPTCRFVPTCSEYALEVFEHRGAWVGFWLTLWRVLRCHPFARGGYDPPPIHRNQKTKGDRMHKHFVFIVLFLAITFLTPPSVAQTQPTADTPPTPPANAPALQTPPTPPANAPALQTSPTPPANAPALQTPPTPPANAPALQTPPTLPANVPRKDLYFSETPWDGKNLEETDPRLTVDTPLFTTQFTLQGAVFSSFRFKSMQYREVAIPKEAMKEKRREYKLQPIDMVKTWSAPFLPFLMEMEIEREAESLEQTTVYHLKRELNFRPLMQKWELLSRTDDRNTIELKFRLVTDHPCPAGADTVPGTCFPAEIYKTYRFHTQRYDVDLLIEVKNLIPAKLNLRKVLFHIYSLHEGESGRGFFNPVSNQKEAICYHADGVSVQSFDVIMNGVSGGCMGCSSSSCSCSRTPSKTGEFPRGARWAGIDARYFLMVLLKNYGADDGGCRFIAQKIQEISGFGLIETQMDLNGPRPIEPLQTLRLPLKIYVGPKDLNFLEQVKLHKAEEPENIPAKLNESVDFGIFWFIGKPMIFLLKLVQKVVVNWGLAIILLTLLIKLVTLYWTNKSMRSMKKMASLKPEMDALQQKYANNKEKLNQEIMALYKRHKVNPLGGCLPMLFQMPIYIAWYQALMASVELYRAPLFGWIQDLTAQDPYFVLPVLMGILMFLQQKMTPSTQDNQQAKVMLYTMPIMFTVIMLFLPSGLTLYILTNTVLGLAHQWYMNHSEDAAT